MTSYLILPVKVFKGRERPVKLPRLEPILHLFHLLCMSSSRHHWACRLCRVECSWCWSSWSPTR